MLACTDSAEHVKVLVGTSTTDSLYYASVVGGTIPTVDVGDIFLLQPTVHTMGIDIYINIIIIITNL